MIRCRVRNLYSVDCVSTHARCGWLKQALLGDDPHSNAHDISVLEAAAQGLSSFGDTEAGEDTILGVSCSTRATQE